MATDDLSGLNAPFVYYRIRMIENGNVQLLSPVIKFGSSRYSNNSMRVLPNPVRDQMQIQINAENAGPGTLSVYDQSGKRVYITNLGLQKGMNRVALNCLAALPDGMYQLVLAADNRLITERILHKK